MVNKAMADSELMIKAVAKIKSDPGISPSSLSRMLGMDRDALLAAVTNADTRVYGGYDGVGLYYDEEQ